MFPRLIAFAALFAIAAPLAAQDDDELAPGLIAHYQSGEVIIRRVDADLAFDWQTGSPDLRLPAGPFKTNWSGQMLLREEGQYRFHAHLHGQVTVRINDQIVLKANSNEPQWVSGEPVELPLGELPIEVDYESAGSSARLFLAWSSSNFPLEPLPHHILFHESTDPDHTLATSLAISQHRCTRCHGELTGINAPPGPSLVHIGVETSEQWLLDQIQHGSGERGKMPKFNFSREDAGAILAVLTANAKPVELPEVAAPTEKDIATGRELLISFGCLACHQWNKQGRGGELSGPNLDDVGKRRTAKWLDQWFRDPAKLNTHHQMPVFTLTDTERKQLVAALTNSQSLAVSQPAKSSPELLSRGNQLINDSRCVACHELPGEKREILAAPQWSELKLTDDGCWSAETKPDSRRPQYAKLSAAGFRDFLRATIGRDVKPSADLIGAKLLIEKGCVNCHDRDGRKGVSALAADLANAHPNLQGRALWLIPPQLTAVGDRLPDERLAKAIRGELPKRRLDWLFVRMPKYQHTDAEQAALTAHLVGHDRIPEKAPALPEYPLNVKQSDVTLAGRELIGGKGFSCVACHPVKDYAPKQVALGTRGSNLFEIGERLRPDYFFRWTRAPLRVMPGVEMPSYQRPHATIYPGDLNKQLAAIWTALNDPDLPTPVNPGAVEQYWTVKPGDPPRILRDVITLPGKKEITVPRSFAVGFPNGHNVLFDLDTASVRAWTIGDFAQQRTQGKSWFWDLVGTPVMVQEKAESDLLILSSDGKTVLFPSAEANVRLTQTHDFSGVEAAQIHYVIESTTSPPRFRAHFVERWQRSPSGWYRMLLVHRSKSMADAKAFALEPGIRGVTVDDGDQSSPVKWQMLSVSARRAAPLPIGTSLNFRYEDRRNLVLADVPTLPSVSTLSAEITVVPGFQGKRLPYPTNIMPTAMTFNHRGQLLFTSLKGHVYSADDNEAKLFAEGLAAPFGILDSHDMVLVAHKPEIVGLVDTDNDGSADEATVIATGWGLTDDYHDWTCGLVRDAEGNLFTTLGSDYAQKNRPLEKSRWRGDAIKIDPAGKIESLARGLRFPTGVAMTADQHIFITDQQGVQNTFNELNWLQPGARFGVPSLHEPEKDAPATPPAVQIPHPWTRSVNGIAAIPKSLADRTHPKLFDQLLGCEYDTRFLVRFSHQLVDGVMQGAVYPFSKPVGSAVRTDGSNAAAQTVRTADPTNGFLGPLSIAVSPDGDVYVGSIHDSGWQGGLNTGDIVKLSPESKWPNGLAEIRATPGGFDLEFFHPVDKAKAEDKSRYQISGYARVWQGSYATPDSGRHNAEVREAKLSDDGKFVSLQLNGLKPGHVYDVVVGEIAIKDEPALWPSIGHYTLHRIPTK